MITEERLQIVNTLGLHARAAARFVQTATRFRSDIEVEKDGQLVNGKSIMGLLTLVGSKGTFITVRARGEDADEALAALRELIAGRFGEE